MTEISPLSVDCSARLEPDGDMLHAAAVKAFVADLPDGAVIESIQRDFGNQRDPELRLVGLRASWSEVR